MTVRQRDVSPLHAIGHARPSTSDAAALRGERAPARRRRAPAPSASIGAGCCRALRARPLRRHSGIADDGVGGEGAAFARREHEGELLRSAPGAVLGRPARRAPRSARAPPAGCVPFGACPRASSSPPSRPRRRSRRSCRPRWRRRARRRDAEPLALEAGAADGVRRRAAPPCAQSAQSTAPSARRWGSLSPMARKSTTGARAEEARVLGHQPEEALVRKASRPVVPRFSQSLRRRPRAWRPALPPGGRAAPPRTKRPSGGSSSGRRRWK